MENSTKRISGYYGSVHVNAYSMVDIALQSLPEMMPLTVEDGRFSHAMGCSIFCQQTPSHRRLNTPEDAPYRIDIRLAVAGKSPEVDSVFGILEGIILRFEPNLIQKNTIAPFKQL